MNELSRLEKNYKLLSKHYRQEILGITEMLLDIQYPCRQTCHGDCYHCEKIRVLHFVEKTNRIAV